MINLLEKHRQFLGNIHAMTREAGLSNAISGIRKDGSVHVSLLGGQELSDDVTKALNKACDYSRFSYTVYAKTNQIILRFTRRWLDEKH